MGRYTFNILQYNWVFSIFIMPAHTFQIIMSYIVDDYIRCVLVSKEGLWCVCMCVCVGGWGGGG